MDTVTRPGGMSMLTKAPNEANWNRPLIACHQGVNVDEFGLPYAERSQFRVVEAGASKGWPRRKLARRQARPTRDRVAQARAEWDGHTREFCQNEPKNPVATRFFAGDSVRWVRSSPAIEPNHDMWHPEKPVKFMSPPIRK